MKIRIIILLFSFLVVVSCQNPEPKNDQNPEPKNDWAEHNLYGQIKSMKVCEYMALEKDGELIKGELNHCLELLFNNIGNIIEDNWYNSNGYVHRILSTYDEKGYLLEIRMHNADDSLQWILVYQNDQFGNELERNRYTADGVLESKTTLQYDDNIRVSTERVYNSDSTLEEKFDYAYDADGNAIQIDHYGGDGKLISKETFVFDSKGREIENYWYEPDGSLSYEYYAKYDNKGNMIDQIYNDLTEHNYSSINTYEYKFDRQGNWIFQIAMDDDFFAGNYIYEREIEYY